MLSKEELDDIWESKPHGYFTKYVKDTKGKKKYVVKTTAYRIKEEVLGEKETVVFAKAFDEALKSASLENAKLGLLRELGYPSWEAYGSTTRFKHTIVRTL
jgi:hypothetical protein